MPSTKMFRDRVVSMEQTYEQGEKHLALLQAIVREALPDLQFKEYLLDHEHDNFVMVFSTPAGREKKISWTRMVLYDAERIPAIAENAESEMRPRIVEFLRTRADRPTIEVTFRHLEQGWVDTPEPRKPKPKPQPPQGRRSGSAADAGRRGQGEPAGRKPEPSRPPAQQGRRPVRQEPSAPTTARQDRGAEGRPLLPAGAPGAPGAAAPAAGERSARGRRRFRRRRRGGGRGPAPNPGQKPV